MPALALLATHAIDRGFPPRTIAKSEILNRQERQGRQEKRRKAKNDGFHHAFLLGALGVLGGFYDFAILLGFPPERIAKKSPWLIYRPLGKLA